MGNPGQDITGVERKPALRSRLSNLKASSKEWSDGKWVAVILVGVLGLTVVVGITVFLVLAIGVLPTLCLFAGIPCAIFSIRWWARRKAALAKKLTDEIAKRRALWKHAAGPASQNTVNGDTSSGLPEGGMPPDYEMERTKSMILFTCGKCNQKFKPEEGVRGPDGILCRQCAQRLRGSTSKPSALSSASQTRVSRDTYADQLKGAAAQDDEVETTKDCPFCGEEIQSSAKKCKHCGEWLETKSGSPVPASEQRRATARGSGSMQDRYSTVASNRTNGTGKRLLLGLIVAAALWFIGSRLSEWGDKQAASSVPQQQGGQQLQQEQTVETPPTQSGLSVSDAAFLDAAKPLMELCEHMAGKRQVGINYGTFTDMLGDMVADYDELKNRPAPTEEGLTVLMQDADGMLTEYKYAADRWKGSIDFGDSDGGVDASFRDQSLEAGDKDLAELLEKYRYLSGRYGGSQAQP